MIGKLTGSIDSIKPSEVIIDVSGVGYCVSISFSTFNAIVGENKTSLFIHTHVREDQIRLFGFQTEDEKKMFETLIQISGIGPSIALSVLSGIDPTELYNAVQCGTVSTLTGIPGIGKSKAEKLIFELKRKLKKPLSASDIGVSPIRSDAIEALVSLGFDEDRSSKCIEDIMKEDKEAPIEIVVKKALKALSK